MERYVVGSVCWLCFVRSGLRRDMSMGQEASGQGCNVLRMSRRDLHKILTRKVYEDADPEITKGDFIN